MSCGSISSSVKSTTIPDSTTCADSFAVPDLKLYCNDPSKSQVVVLPEYKEPMFVLTSELLDIESISTFVELVVNRKTSLSSPPISVTVPKRTKVFTAL